MQKFRFDEPGPALRVACIGAHCDDIEIGCGGLLLELCRARPRVSFRWFIAVAPQRRAAETRLAAARLLSGAASHEIAMHEFADGYLPYSAAEVKRALDEFSRLGPADLVLTHSREDLHQDHRFLAEITWQTFRDHLILEYEIPKYDGDLGRPNWFVPLDREIVERKVECLLDCFPSQQDKPWFEARTFRALMRLRGVECRAPSGYAEAFYLRKGVWHFPAPGSS